MADSDRTRKELLEELRNVRRRLETLEKQRAGEGDAGGPAGPTRREVLKAAWVSPIILSLGLPGGAGAGTIMTTPTPTGPPPTFMVPTAQPTLNPTANPTLMPTANPTLQPTANPTTVEPTTAEPTTASPSLVPTANPTAMPTTAEPTTVRPTTEVPTVVPTIVPTVVPTAAPTTPPRVPVIPLLNPDD